MAELAVKREILNKFPGTAALSLCMRRDTPCCLLRLLGVLALGASRTAICRRCRLRKRAGGGQVVWPHSVRDELSGLQGAGGEQFPDLRVQMVDTFPDAPGKWQKVDSLPDFKVQIVDSFPDMT